MDEPKPPKRPSIWINTPRDAPGVKIFKIDQLVKGISDDEMMELTHTLQPIISDPIIHSVLQTVDYRTGWQVWLGFDEIIAERIKQLSSTCPDAHLIMLKNDGFLRRGTVRDIVDDGLIGITRIPTDHHVRAVLRTIFLTK